MLSMDGEELCRRIQQELPKREFLIIVLTSKAETELRAMSHERSKIMLLEKSVSIRKLISLLKGYFEKQGIN